METKQSKFEDRFIKCPKCRTQFLVDSKEYQEMKLAIEKIRGKRFPF